MRRRLFLQFTGKVAAALAAEPALPIASAVSAPAKVAAAAAPSAAAFNALVPSIEAVTKFNDTYSDLFGKLLKELDVFSSDYGNKYYFIDDAIRQAAEAEKHVRSIEAAMQDPRFKKAWDLTHSRNADLLTLAETHQNDFEYGHNSTRKMLEESKRHVWKRKSVIGHLELHESTTAYFQKANPALEADPVTVAVRNVNTGFKTAFTGTLGNDTDPALIEGLKKLSHVALVTEENHGTPGTISLEAVLDRVAYQIQHTVKVTYSYEKTAIEERVLEDAQKHGATHLFSRLAQAWPQAARRLAEAQAARNKPTPEEAPQQPEPSKAQRQLEEAKPQTSQANQLRPSIVNPEDNLNWTFKYKGMRPALPSYL